MNKGSKIKQVQKTLAINGKYNIEVFNRAENQIIKSEDCFFDVITFGKNAIIRADEAIYDWCVSNLSEVEANRIMDGDKLFQIEGKLREYGKKLAGEHVRYLYLDEHRHIPKPSGFEYKLYNKKDMEQLYEHKGFDNALNYKNDVIAIGAFYENQLVALVGADDYLTDLWQIGIDTLPSFRNKGLAVYLVKTLADEIVKNGALPYYTTWSANIASTMIAIKTGFYPTWVGYYAEDKSS